MANPSVFARKAIRRLENRAKRTKSEEDLARQVIDLSKSSGKSVEDVLESLRGVVKASATNTALGGRAFRVNVAGSGGYLDQDRVRRMSYIGSGKMPPGSGGNLGRAANAVGRGAQAFWDKKVGKAATLKAGLTVLPWVTIPVTTGYAVNKGKGKIKSALEGVGNVGKSIWKGLP